jgi:hypothetical protein
MVPSSTAGIHDESVMVSCSIAPAAAAEPTIQTAAMRAASAIVVSR